MTGRRPAGMERWPAAAADTVDALSVAAEGAVARFRAALDRHGVPAASQPTGSRAQRAITLGLMRALGARCEADDIVECPHITDDERPVFWLPFIPRAYLCAECLTTAPTPIECDGCARRSLLLTRWALAIATRTTIVSFLCPRCTHVMDGGAR